MLSIFKATNEPLLSNKWLFYVPGELKAVEWANQALANRSFWTEQDERVITGAGIRTENRLNALHYDLFEPNAETRDFLISDVTRARSARMSAPLPTESDSFRTYDNGQAQIYHLRPRTPYQQ